MKLKILAGILAVTTLAGCATGGDYAAYAQAIEAQARYNAAAKIASANALREIGKTAGETSKTVAALQLGNELKQGTSGSQETGVQAPVSASQEARAWASIVLPTVVGAYGIKANKDLGIVQSNNSRDVAMSTNATFLGLGQQIKPNYNNSFNSSGATSSLVVPSNALVTTQTLGN